MSYEVPIYELEEALRTAGYRPTIGGADFGSKATFDVWAKGPDKVLVMSDYGRGHATAFRRISLAEAAQCPVPE